MKKETLEEAAKKSTNIPNLSWENEYAYNKFLEGAKYQQEQDNLEIKQLKNRLDIIRESTAKTIKMVEDLKLQQEISYSEEEVLFILLDCPYEFKDNIIQWFEQFKKK